MQSGREVLGTYMDTLSIVEHQVLGTGGLSSGERVIPLGFCSRRLLGGLIDNHYPTEFHFPISSCSYRGSERCTLLVTACVYIRAIGAACKFRPRGMEG